VGDDVQRGGLVGNKLSHRSCFDLGLGNNFSGGLSGEVILYSWGNNFSGGFYGLRSYGSLNRLGDGLGFGHVGSLVIGFGGMG
jgi:hypothetical protein